MAESPVASALARVVASLPGGGEAREGQVAMAEGVAKAISTDRHLVVRAGTGTGKSLAYLVPAVMSGRRVVIATATKALQDQLANKDLPSLTGKVKRPFDYAVLKGRSNYLCVQRVRESELTGAQQTMGEGGGATASRESERLARRASSPSGPRRRRPGTRPNSPSNRTHAWSSFSVSADECPGVFRCPSGGECFAEAARACVAEADVIVVNLHLLGADIASGGSVLPEHDCLIIDEAHEFEEVMSRSLGVSIGAGRLRAVAALGRSVGGSGTRARPSPGTVDDAIAAVIEAAERLETCLQARAGHRIRPAEEDELTEIVTLTASRLERLETALRRRWGPRATTLVLSGPCSRSGGSATSSPRSRVSPRTASPGSSPRRGRRSESRRSTSHRFSPRSCSRRCRWCSPARRFHPDWRRASGAAAKSTDELDVGSPFDFEQHALLYCAAHLPDRRNANSEAAIHAELVAVDACCGRSHAGAVHLKGRHGASRSRRAPGGSLSCPCPRRSLETSSRRGFLRGRRDLSVRDDGFLAGS